MVSKLEVSAIFLYEHEIVLLVLHLNRTKQELLLHLVTGVVASRKKQKCCVAWTCEAIYGTSARSFSRAKRMGSRNTVEYAEITPK